MGSILSSTQVAVPKVATPQRVRVSSGVSTGLLIRKVTPNYPQLAKQARIQGSVVLQAEISKEGTIQNLQLISGHPMLAPAAIEAVKQWRYKPYLLNGEPVAVETQVVVNFSLSGARHSGRVGFVAVESSPPSEFFPRRETEVPFLGTGATPPTTVFLHHTFHQ